MKPLGLSLASLIGTAATIAAAADAYSVGAAQCSSLKDSLKLADTIVTDAIYLQANTTFQIPDAHPTCEQNSTVPVNVCRVLMTTKTTNTSETKTELWLPDDFNRRVATAGNGGFNGCVFFDPLKYLSKLGFAVIGSDAGHAGQTAEPFLNHPEVMNDFSYRSIHVSTVLLKAVSRAYYSTKHKNSYYLGCSQGGRQGFKAIQTYPEDFDGVLAGAPGIDFNRLMDWFGVTGTAGTHDPATTVSPELLLLVHADIMAKCDELDGVKNGIIDDPDKCNYVPGPSILCTSGTTNTSSSCLTTAQLSTIETIFSPIKYNGENIYPRTDPGTPWAPVLWFVEQWLGYGIYNVTDYNATNFNATEAIPLADAINPGGISTWDPPAMRPFARRGGKVLTYHGRADVLIPGGVSVKWWKAVSKAVGGRRKMDEFYRFFSVPGMGHCWGGVGTGDFGQLTSPVAEIQSPETNAMLALVDWVENGNAPDELTASNAETRVTRRICAWPKRSVLKSGGDPDSASGWECVE